MYTQDSFLKKNIRIRVRNLKKNSLVKIWSVMVYLLFSDFLWLSYEFLSSAIYWKEWIGNIIIIQ